jgi:hypothetical protein
MRGIGAPALTLLFPALGRTASRIV